MKTKIPYLSIVSPVYMAEDIVDELVKRITEEASKVTQDFEIILVEDGGKDHSWKKIEENCKKDYRVKGIKLSRNFGQHYALSAGLHQSSGEMVVVLDCDLQDNPKYIPDLVNKSLQGYDIVYTMHRRRNHGKVKNFFATIFHKLFNWLVDNKELNTNGKIGTYSLLTRKAVDSFCKIQDYHRHYLSVMRWLGYNHSFITIDHEERFAGKTSYTFNKLLALTIDGIVSQTDKLLKLSIYIGFLLSFIGLLSIFYIILMAVITKGFQPGWASTTVLIIFSTGLILSFIGVVGMYVAKIFEQTKERPLYVIDNTLNLND